MNRELRLLLWGGLGLLAVAAVVIGFAIAGGEEESAEFETAFAETLGSPLAPHDGSGSAIGETAPGFSVQTNSSDARLHFDMADGTVRLVEFFAHWCPHCQAELPRQVDWLADNQLPSGVEILTVSTAVDQGAPNYPPSSWFAREGWPLPVYVDSVDGAIARGYGLSGFPFYVLVDGSGKVVERGSGELTEEQFTALIARAADAR